jgi:CubicO group peptidase (beta-lactamase class C family)
MSENITALDPPFEPVAQFLSQACDGQGAGAQLAVFSHGELVVDVTVGRGIEPGNLSPVLSVSKGMTGLCIARMLDAGLLDVSARVAHYWPEFAQGGKEQVTIEQALSHSAGLPFFDIDTVPIAWRDDDALAAAHLAAQSPLWRPGAALAYHPVTIGTIAGELSRRVVGIGIQEYFEAEIRHDRGLDAYLGVPESEIHRIISVPMPMFSAEPGDSSLSTMIDRSLSGIFSLDALANDGASHRAGHAAAGGVASARGLATLYAAALWGDQQGVLFSEGTRRRVAAVAATGPDLASGALKSFGVLFQKPTRERRFASFSAFGHEGAGGAIAYADPDADITFAFVPSRDLGEPLPDELSRMLRTIVGSAPTPTTTS